MPEPRLQVTFWGTRGSISTPGRETSVYGGNTPCVLVSYGQDAIILDAGTGLRPLGLSLAANPRISEHHIFLSHTHWDHIQGIPFFQPAYLPHSRIHFYGSPQKERLLEQILTGQMTLSYFPVQMSDLPASIQISELVTDTISIGALQVHHEEQIYHPGGSLRFRISAGGRSVVYATDVEIDAAMDDTDPESQAASNAQAYRTFIAGTDLLIADAQYTRAQYAAKKGWGHSSLETVIETARQCSVKQLALFHHDPDHTDAYFAAQEASIQQNAPDLHTFFAREGTTLTL